MISEEVKDCGAEMQDVCDASDENHRHDPAYITDLSLVQTGFQSPYADMRPAVLDSY